MKKAVVITGTNGGIGAALKEKFSEEGYAVIGIGKSPDQKNCDAYIQVDFIELARSEEVLKCFCEEILPLFKKYSLAGLINNSALQILADTKSLTLNDFQSTLSVNLIVPFILSKICLEFLQENKGSIVNIGSIHAKLTKKTFVAYATSKGALETMTKAMAVDVGSKVRVNLIAPAAIETEMLVDGFKACPEKYTQLKDCHPTGSIGQPEEVANIAFYLINGSTPFLNGAVIDLTGGISAKLCDPAEYN
ncbi:SDR family NAD(P)-dependent oxidoreductase [Zhongshania sp. BJYM1]|uniref:SDR family NAD(P)-dependent oxidoreductase n=1 Tax=Zhongshania aquatica TaxID=2965069 RepID=UPI0022B2B01F|nr:SDR family oxidoreductase [Marortus sp. BJYM1]